MDNKSFFPIHRTHIIINNKIAIYIIFILLDLYLIIDSVTGILLHSGGISLSIPYKVFIAGLMFFTAVCHGAFTVIFFIGSLTWFFLILFMMFFDQATNIGLVAQTYTKIFVNYIFYKYFSTILRNKLYDDLFEFFMKFNSIIFILNIFLGTLGLGYSTYSYGVGVKGFFYAGNEIFLILLSITVFYLLKNPRNNKTKFIYIISLILAVLIGTKTAMLAVLLICLLNYYLFMSKKNKFLFFILFPAITLLVVIFLFPIVSELRPLASAIYNFNKVRENTGSILNALLSNRVFFLQNNLEYWKENLNFSKLFFGSGNYLDGKGVEIDFFDTLILNGAVVTVFTLLFYLDFIFTALKIRNYLLLFFNILVLLISFSAGHIWANLTGGIFFVATNAYAKEKYLRVIRV